MTSGPNSPRLATRVRILAGLLAAALAALSVGAASASAAPGSPLPTGFLGITPNIKPNDRDLQRIHESGSTTVRYALSWASIQKDRGDPLNWQGADQYMARASRAGLSVDLLLSTTPRWATSAQEPSTFHSPIETTVGRIGWANFVRSAVNRYGHSGSFWEAHPDLTYRPSEWTIWNEPNLIRFWAGGPNAGDFARLMNFTGPIVRRADPQAEIVAGGIFCQYAWQIYLKHFYGVVDKSSFDAVAIHPYNNKPYGSFDLMLQARKIMDRAGDQDADLYVDEISWGTDETKKRFVTSPKKQAENIRILFQILAYQRDRLHLQKLLWFGIRDDPRLRNCQFCASSGLWQADGTTPKPSFHVFRGYGAGPAGEIRGAVYDKGSKPLADQRVYLDLNGDDYLEPGEPQRSTLANGTFTFPSLYPTSYAVRLLPRGDHECVEPVDCSRTAQVKGGQTVDGLSFVVGPKSDTRITMRKIKSKKDKAKFKFKGMGGRGPYKFHCRLDSKHWNDCDSPKTYRHLKPGRHKLKVRAEDRKGKRDPSPAEAKFKIKRKHHHRHHHHHH